MSDVRDLVVALQISATKVPKVVRDRVLYDQIVPGSEVMTAANEVEALSTVEFVLAFTAEVPAVMLAASEVEAARTEELVFVLTAVVTAAVPAVILAAMDVEALVTSD